MTAAQRRTLTAVLVSAGTLLGAAACSSSGGLPGSGTLSYDDFRSTARKAAAEPTDTCPFGLDLAKALRTAGISADVSPDAKEGHAVDAGAADGDPAKPWPSNASHPPSMPSIPATPPRAFVSCTYRVGHARMDLELMAVPQAGAAVNLMFPLIQHNARVGIGPIQQFATEQPDAGQAKLVPGGKDSAAVARIAPKGSGDIALLLSQVLDDDAAPDPALTGEQLRKATEALAAQLR
ncbi:hypothetical protein [Streptomyces sp. NRRL S-350]|uniref:hypothetical protein n=1 Tax=Streptomyces sp. NRRL S-350 TaxID=1463902 RepID=UPI0004C0D2A0|nr:hypothetical protein [Streptomyces sp. NRRL S-350]